MGLDQIPHNFMTARLEDIVRWGRRNSVFPATFGLVAMAVFVLVLLIPFAYLLSVGALEWAPVRDVIERLPGPLLRTDKAVLDPTSDPLALDESRDSEGQAA